MSVLTVSNLVIGYKGTPILPSISFSLEPGQVTSIIGHNGSGKSTLLKTLLGLNSKVSGALNFGLSAQVGYVPQRENMDPIYPIRVSELVETGRFGIRGVGRLLNSLDHERVKTSMQLTGTSHLSHRLFRTLSGGEQQRALLARALCTEPTLLILDEPTASMDENGAKQALEMTLDLARRQNAAVLMVSHFLDIVAEISDQIILLDRDHQTVKIGPPKDVLKNKTGMQL